MTELQRYLAEEVAEDLADGIITRREAVRRLGLLGVTGAAATGLLATFAAAPAAAGPEAQGGGRGSSETTWAPVPRESITFAGPRGPLLAAWAPAAKPRGGVLVIHENRGLTEHIRAVAGRLAASGYSALALDLLSEEGGTGAFPGEAEVAAALSAIPPERFVADMKASVTELKRRVRGKRLAAIGFCFGGAMVWRLLASSEPRLAAAAPFYGPFPTDGDLSGSRAAVLGVYGGLDTRVNATLPAAKAALDAARLRYELLTFSEADHAFFNDTGARFNPHAATEVWHRVLTWFDAATGHH
ncbi:dienelactone hydrolase family protein [Micromonospora sp. CPCC 205371]|nr:dienelactone hydrolase family protein [Micromonospora sp. CPCC 205371]